MRTDDIRYTINRSIILVFPKQAAVDWISAADPAPFNMDLSGE